MKKFKKNHDLEQLKVFISKVTEFQNITGMHFLMGDNSFGQMTQKRKNIDLLKEQDQIISQAIILEGSTRSNKNRFRSFNSKFSIKENDRTIFNFYTCQHILTKQDLQMMINPFGIY